MTKRGYIFSSRKGLVTHKMLMLIFNMVLGAVVGLTIFGYVNSALDKADFEKNYLSKDLSYLIDVLYFAPGDVDFEYNADSFYLEKFNYNFNNGRVTVIGTIPEYGFIPRYYYFGEDKKITPYPQDLISPYSIKFAKKDNSIFLGKEGDGKTYLDCPRVGPESLDYTKIIFDIGHGSSTDIKEKDTGLINEEGIKEEDITTKIGTVLEGLSGSVRFTRKLSNNKFASIEDRKNKIQSGDVVISLHLGKQSADKNDLIIYYSVGNKNSERSRKLACLIANNIYLKNNEFTSIKIYPLSTKMFTELESERILENENIGILIEMGNIDYFGEVSANANPSQIGIAIWNGIQSY